MIRAKIVDFIELFRRKTCKDDGCYILNLTKNQIEDKGVMEKMLLQSGFDLNGRVTITEIKKGLVWRYEQNSHIRHRYKDDGRGTNQ